MNLETSQCLQSKRQAVVLNKSPHNLELYFQLCYFQITPQASVDQTVIFRSSILLTSYGKMKMPFSP